MSVVKNIDFNNCQIGRPAVIGIYGVAGSGNTFVLNALKHAYDTNHILLEGSEVISRLVHGGLEGFEALEEARKKTMRELALRTIVADCLNDGKTAVVTGHFMFWPRSRKLHSYYLLEYAARDHPPPSSSRYCQASPRAFNRPIATWQCEEEMQLRSVCYRSGIIYYALEHDIPLPKVTQLIELFLHRSQESHRRELETQLDGFVGSSTKHLASALALDADKTLSAADSGHLFWKHVHQRCPDQMRREYLNDIFGGPLGYTSAAFLQAALLYEELVTQNIFDEVCTSVATEISLYPDVATLLLKARNEEETMIFVVTCGLRFVWKKVLERYCLLDSVKILGSGPLTGAHVITPQIEARLVAHLQRRYDLQVVALGDSVLDLDMLAQADRAVVIVGDEQTRSRRMEEELAKAINDGRLSANQAILARGSPPRLNTAILPLVDLNGSEFYDHILRSSPLSQLTSSYAQYYSLYGRPCLQDFGDSDA
nr:hypothetical protein LTR18_011126 [Exophiala xenobiotica]